MLPAPLAARRVRRSVVTGLALALTASAASLAVVPAAHAADRTVFTLVGTSDVSDSDLVSKVLEPRFEALYPQYDLQYVPQGTGAALNTARAGNAAATIVHAASVENQFVADGYSLEQYGRLAFWGDYVLLGPNDDPAGVAAAAPHDVVAAFERVAAAGAANRASFVTRGGTPGTAVQEHALWRLTSGVATCTIGNASGGGTRPKDPTDASTTCTMPDDQTTDANATPPDTDGARRPTWYGAGSSTSQAANVNIANTCSTGAFPNGSCYVFTDRGTYKNLRAQGLAQNLKIVTRDNAATARGGRDALINVFHAYGVNPAKFSSTSGTKLDPVAARLFLDFLTSTSVQQAIGAYLSEGADPTFIPAAAPVTTAVLGATRARQGKPLTVSGSIANAVPGYPALGGVPVTLVRSTSDSPLAVPTVVATTTTDAAGGYTFRQVLAAGSYRVAVPPIAKVEIATLSPVFGSLLTATSVPVGAVNGFTVKRAKPLASGRVKVPVRLGAPSDGAGKVKLFAKQGGRFRLADKTRIEDGATRATLRPRLAAGTRIRLVFTDAGATLPTTSKVKTLKLQR